MAFPIIPKKRSGATGSPTSLTVGELAVNTATGELFLGGDEFVLLLNPPTAAGTTATERTGDGTTVAFTFTGYNGTADGGYLVSVGGIDQPPSKYEVTNTAGGTITFVEAPTAGELISIRALVASGGGGGSGTVTSITAGAGLDGGTITESGTISMPDVGTPQTAVGGGLVIPVISTDAQGRVTALTTVACPALTTAQIAGLATTAPAALATSAVVGLSTFAARADHQHAFPTAANVGALGATASASGDLTGNYPGPTLAAITTAQSNVGSSTVVPVLSVDAKGRVTSLSTAAISSATTSAITSLTGDVIAAGPGAASAALAAITTAQSNVGSSSEIPVISIDAKGRVTALSVALISGAYTVEVLLAAGGGSGGSAGGGGGGGVISATGVSLVSGQTYSIVIGAGGSGGSGATFLGNTGSNTTGFSLTALGGGGGGRWSTTADNQNGLNGGSGGGAGLNSIGASNAGGAGTSGQGFAGGSANQAQATGYAAGGGGGAAAVGGNKSASVAGAGGAGILNAINGSSLYWAGGGGGGGQQAGAVAGNGGIGGGGGGAISSGGGSGVIGTGGGSALNAGGNGNTTGTGGAGGANTGGGGGAMAISVGTAASGGSGVVILRYSGAQRGTGGTVTSAGGNTIHTFLTSGTYTA